MQEQDTDADSDDEDNSSVEDHSDTRQHPANDGTSQDSADDIAQVRLFSDQISHQDELDLIESHL